MKMDKIIYPERFTTLDVLAPVPLAGILALFLYGHLGLDPWVPVALLLTVFPFLFAASIGWYVLYVVLRKTTYSVLLFTLALVLAAFRYTDFIMPTDVSGVEQSSSIRVMTWNVQRMGYFDTREHVPTNLDAATAKIRHAQPDVLVLQEISRRHLNALQRRLGLQSNACHWTDYHGRGIDHLGGLAICVINDREWTILTKRSLDLPPSWKYLFVEIADRRDQTFNLLGLHLVPPKVTEDGVREMTGKTMRLDMSAFSDLLDTLREYRTQIHLQENQIQKVIERIQNFRDPTVMAGDFNTPPDLPLHYRLRGQFQDAWGLAGTGLGYTRVWGGFLPLRIDFIYASKSLAVGTAGNLDAGVSDHRPVIATLYLNSDS